MKNVKPPRFLTNLYRDMRDRHLLLPVVLLAVALVAVPVLLTSGHSSSAAPPTSASPKASGSSEAIPAVVTQELGITNYKKRLDRNQSRDPFQGPPSTQGVSNRVKHASITNANIPSTSSTASGSTSSASTSSTSSTSSVTPSTSSSTPATGSPSTGSSPSGASSPQTTHHNKPRSQLYTYRVSVKVGEPGKLADRPDVSSLALLPSKSRPVLSFLEANGKQALFNVSNDVDSVRGDGRCAPKPANCQYIRMTPGDKASFNYAPSNKRFNLVLKDIHAVKVGHKRPSKVSRNAG